MKIKRTLYNPYNHIVEVYFDNGAILTGAYTIETRNETNSGIIGIFINIDFKDEPYEEEYKSLARESLLKKISDDIQKFTFKEFYK